MSPVKPVAPVKPVSPVAPVKPVNPVAPVNPVEPVAPVKPVYPVKPVKPATHHRQSCLLNAFTAGIAAVSSHNSITAASIQDTVTVHSCGPFSLGSGR